MAKKFVKVTGLHKVFSAITATGATTWSYTGTLADENSILYITADADDTTTFGNPYREGTHWIWAKGQLFDGNEVDSTYLASISRDASNAAIALTDDLELIINKLMYQVADAKSSGVQSLTTSDDSWIVIDPDLNVSTGAVTLNVSHGMPQTATAPTSVEVESLSGWGNTVTFNATDVSVDARGHVTTSTERTYTVTLPDTPVTTISTSDDDVVTITELTSVTGDVTLEVAHATSGVTAGTYGSKDGSTLKLASVTVDANGHATSANETNEVSTGLKLNGQWVELGADYTKGAVSLTADGSTRFVTGADVAAAIDEKVASSVSYLGLVSSQNELDALTPKNGDFVRVQTAFGEYHASDLLVYDEDSESWEVVHGESDSWREIKVNGTQVIAATAATALDISAGAYMNVTGADTGKVSIDASTCSLKDASAGTKDGLATAYDVATELIAVEQTCADGFGAIKESVGLGEDFSVDWDGSFDDDTTIVDAIKELKDSATSVSYVQESGAVTDHSWTKIGTLTIDGTATDVNGLTYTHPSAPTTGTEKSATAGTASATTVLTGVALDANGHVASLTSSDISAAYNQRAVKVNGTDAIAATADTALDISAGDNITVEYADNKVVISAADNTDENVLAEASEDKMYILGQTATGTAAHANFDEDVYSEAGAFHATSLYEGSWSVHDSSAGDWGEI